MKKKQHIIILVLSFLLLPLDGKTSVPDSLFITGNEAYINGNFELAIEKYNTILDSGYASASLYYNLGNAYFKANETTRAILNYERARLLDPNDEEILFNLELAQTFVIDNIEPLPEFVLVTYYKKFVNSLPVDGWAFISLVLFFLVLVSFLLYLFSSRYGTRKTSFILGIVLFVFSLSAFGLAASRKSMQMDQNGAIIFSPNVTVKSSPDENGTDLFVLHEGAKVNVVDEVGEWNEITIASGNKGWVKSSSLEKI